MNVLHMLLYLYKHTNLANSRKCRRIMATMLNVNVLENAFLAFLECWRAGGPAGLARASVNIYAVEYNMQTLANTVFSIHCIEQLYLVRTP